MSTIAEDEEAFDVLYCIAFELMDAQWLAMQASYMEFNVLCLPLFLSLCLSLSLMFVHDLFSILWASADLSLSLSLSLDYFFLALSEL